MLLRKAAERGQENLDWLTERYSFSFGSYRDPQWAGYRSLRVLNESLIQPGRGFPMHPHANVEVISYILEGSYTHTTSAGHRNTLEAGQAQVISAGTGIFHSADNLGEQPVRMLQIWLLPDRRGGDPVYVDYTPDHRNQWGLLASPQGRAQSVLIRQQAEIYLLHAGQALAALDLPPRRRHAWLHVAQGSVRIGVLELTAGDGVGLEGDEIPARMEVAADSRVVLFMMD